MFTPPSLTVALLMMIISAVCWGSWANTFKGVKNYRFELFYWDYAIGIFLISLVLALTILAACPELHHWVHGEHADGVRASAGTPSPAAPHLPTADDDDGGCAFTLFAQGLVLAAAFLALVLADGILRSLSFPQYAGAAPVPPRFRLLPSQAPPASA